MIKSNSLLAVAILFALLSPQSALAKLNLAAELMRSKILNPDQSVSADVHEHEATISTYVNRKADPNMKDEVCRLDALLIAKKVTELMPSLSKIRVWFHEYSGSNYREVVVVVDDLKRFEAGELTRFQLMARLRVKLALSLKTAEVYAKTARADQPSGIKTGTGVSFYYPKGWCALPTSNGDLLAVVSSRADLGGPDIRLLIIDPIEAVTDPGTKRKIRIGYGGTYMGLEVVTNSVGADGQQRIDKHVYFDDGQYHYKIGVVCNPDEFPKINKDFNFVLSTLRWKS